MRDVLRDQRSTDGPVPMRPSASAIPQGSRAASVDTNTSTYILDIDSDNAASNEKAIPDSTTSQANSGS